jgi:hypothetical protein
MFLAGMTLSLVGVGLPLSLLSEIVRKYNAG